MRYFVLLLAFCFALGVTQAPLAAAARNTHPSNTHVVKAKKNKHKVHKSSKRKNHSRTRVG